MRLTPGFQPSLAWPAHQTVTWVTFGGVSNTPTPESPAKRLFPFLPVLTAFIAIAMGGSAYLWNTREREVQHDTDELTAKLKSHGDSIACVTELSQERLRLVYDLQAADQPALSDAAFLEHFNVLQKQLSLEPDSRSFQASKVLKAAILQQPGNDAADVTQVHQAMHDYIAARFEDCRHKMITEYAHQYGEKRGFCWPSALSGNARHGFMKVIQEAVKTRPEARQMAIALMKETEYFTGRFCDADDEWNAYYVYMRNR